MPETQEAKELRKIKSEMQILKDTQSEISKKQTELSKKEAELQKIVFKQNPNIEVSDHAILRYIQRMFNLDIEMVKSQIVTDELQDFIFKHRGSGKFHLENFSAVVKNYKVITVIGSSNEEIQEN